MGDYDEPQRRGSVLLQRCWYDWCAVRHLRKSLELMLEGWPLANLRGQDEVEGRAKAGVWRYAASCQDVQCERGTLEAGRVMTSSMLFIDSEHFCKPYDCFSNGLRGQA